VKGVLLNLVEINLAIVNIVAQPNVDGLQMAGTYAQDSMIARMLQIRRRRPICEPRRDQTVLEPE
jgi:hypothetical protein